MQEVACWQSPAAAWSPATHDAGRAIPRRPGAWTLVVGHRTGLGSLDPLSLASSAAWGLREPCLSSGASPAGSQQPPPYFSPSFLASGSCI
jgi:hypothetical protein